MEQTYSESKHYSASSKTFWKVGASDNDFKTVSLPKHLTFAFGAQEHPASAHEWHVI